MDKNQQTYMVSFKRFSFLSLLFFLSGASSLILQVVWMYRIGLIFGNASYATAATLAAFFLGLAIGGWFLGRACAKFSPPLTAFGFMEIGIALTALLLIPGIAFYETHYASVVAFIEGQRSLLTFFKFIFSMSLLLLPSVLMGGTFPVLAQFVGKDRRQLASRGTILYGVNTIGASIGAFLAGFYFLSTYGVNYTYNLAIILAAGIGVIALILDRLPVKRKVISTINKNIKVSLSFKKATEVSKVSANITYSQFVFLAFFSGLLALSAETIWTRMFAQVLQNSVYSFSAILVVFLLALGFGGLLSHILIKFSFPAKPVLVILMSLGAITVGFSPVVFNSLTDGLGYLAFAESWSSYILAVFKLSFLVVFIPTVIFGAIFPFLLKAAPIIDESSGKFVGKLVLFNSFGSAVGPVISGFVLLGLVGLWSSIKIIAVSYVILAIYVAFSLNSKKKLKWMIIPIVVVFGMVAFVNPSTVKLGKGEKVIDMWQSSDGVVSIVKSEENIEMRLDNFYVLGDSKSILVEQMQAHIPLLLHPNPKNTLFLGMGTGISAGASLNHDLEHVVIVELVSNVIPAAKRYFSAWTNNLFEDKRVDIIADDARNYLLGTDEKFDVIVGDLFTPWHAGTGSLYTIEHFQQVKKQLNDGGVFAQWLPLYQLTPESFQIIAATFASVFPEVTLWRADFSSSRASIALIGQEKGSQLSEEILKKNIVYIIGDTDSSKSETDHMAGLFYLGNLKALKNQLANVSINNDDRRTVEFKTPILTQQANAGQETYIVNSALDDLLSTLAINLPAEQDPYLSELPPNEIRYVKVGLLFYQYQMLIANDKDEEAKNIFEQINLLVPNFLKTPLQSLK